MVAYINAIYSIFSYGLARYAGIHIFEPLPPAVSIELSSLCNLSCPECLTGTGTLKRKSGLIDFSLAEKIACEISGHSLSAYLYFQGEPMMHPQFYEIVRLFRKMHPVIATNGHFLDKDNCVKLTHSGLRKIIISYDGMTPGTYNIYRREGDHSKVTEGIRLLAETVRREGSTMIVELQFLIGRHNEHEVREAARFARSIGARFIVKTMQVLDTDRAEIWMPVNDNRSRYLIREGKASRVHAPEKGCLRMWTTAVITIEGDVVPCCFDKNGSYAMGNIKDQTFRDVWHSDKYRAFRKSVLKGRSVIDICKECPQGTPLLFHK